MNDETVTVTDNLSFVPEPDIEEPIVEQPITMYEKQKECWNKQGTDVNGILQDNTTGNDRCISLQKEFFVKVMRQFGHEFKQCLELGVGGPL